MNTVFPLSASHAEARAVNLRPDKDRQGALVAVGMPVPVGAAGRLSPLRGICVTDAQGTRADHLLCRNLGSGSSCVIDSEGRAIAFPSQVSNLIDAGDNHFLGFTDSGIVPVIFDSAKGFYRALPAAASLEPFVFRTFSTGRVSVSVSPRTLSANYATASHLADNDIAAVSADVSDACRRISAIADSVGALLQPVLVRYRLLDHSGRDVYVSNPVMLSPEDIGPQYLVSAEASVTTNDKGRSVVGEYTFGLQSFQVGFTVPASVASAWKGYARSYVVEISPQLDPLDLSRRIICSMNPRTDSQRSLTILLPGAEAALQHVIGAVPAFIDHFDSQCRTLCSGLLAEADTPDGGLTVQCVPFTEPVPVDRRYALTASAIASRKPVDSVLASLQLPHSPVPSGVVVSGNAALWHGLQSVRFPGYSPVHYFQGRESPCSSVSRLAAHVEFADGSSSVVSCTRSGGIPSGLNPLIVYPSPDAVKITFVCLIDGVCRKFEYPLRPTPCRKAAYWLRPDCMPAPFDNSGESADIDGFYIPAASPAPVPYPAFCAVSPVTNLLKIISVQPVGVGHVIAACESSSSASLVDSPKFTVFTGRGIHRLTVSSDAACPEIRSSRLVDRRVLASPDALCSDGGVIYALAGGDLLGIGGNKVSTLMRGLCTQAGSADAALGFSPRGELWISLPDRLLVRDSLTAACYFRLQPDGSVPRYSRMVALSGALYALEQGGLLCDLARESVDLMKVEWHERRILAGPAAPPRRIRAMRLGLDTLFADGVVQLLTPCGAGPFDSLMPQGASAGTSPIASLRVSGKITAPVTVPVIAPPLSEVRLRLDMNINSGARINFIGLCC